jgi:hypothetical protein
VLAAPFGTANLMPVPVVAARSGAPLTRADVTAMALQGRLRAVSGVDKVVDLGRASDARAEQLVALVFGKSSGPRGTQPRGVLSRFPRAGRQRVWRPNAYQHSARLSQPLTRRPESAGRPRP